VLLMEVFGMVLMMMMLLVLLLLMLMEAEERIGGQRGISGCGCSGMEC